MGFAKRFRTYMIGFFLGCVMVFFMFNDRLSMLTAWMPNNRVLLRLQLTEVLYTDEALCQLRCFDLDTADVSVVRHTGDVRFNLSETRVEPKIYVVDTRLHDRLVRMSFTASDTTSILSLVEVPLSQKGCDC